MSELRPGWLKRQLDAVGRDGDGLQWLIDNGYAVSHGTFKGEASPYYSTVDYAKVARDLKKLKEVERS